MCAKEAAVLFMQPLHPASLGPFGLFLSYSFSFPLFLSPSHGCFCARDIATFLLGGMHARRHSLLALRRKRRGRLVRVPLPRAREQVRKRSRSDQNGYRGVRHGGGTRGRKRKRGTRQTSVNAETNVVTEVGYTRVRTRRPKFRAIWVSVKLH